MGDEAEPLTERRSLIANILRTYILKKALLSSLTALTGLVLLMVISKLFGDITMFAEYDTGLSTIAQYLALSIPKMIHLVLPFSVCLGILAAQAALARNSEIIAMQACSVPAWKIYAPYLIVGILATFLMAGTSFYLYPMSQRAADRIENLSIEKSDVSGSFTISGGRFKVGQDIYGVDNLDVTRGTMENITCYRFSSGRLQEVVRAKSAHWDGEKWAASGMKIIELGGHGISEPRPSSVLPLAKEPEDLVMAQTNTEVLSLPELREYIGQLQEGGTASPTTETLYHSRISFSIAPFVISLLVIPFGMSFPRAGGIARGISIGLILGLSYWFLHSGMTELGASGYLRPLIASWGANLAALILAFIILVRKRGAMYG